MNDLSKRPTTLTAKQQQQWEDTGLITFDEERLPNDCIWNNDGTLLGELYDNVDGNTWRMATADTVFMVQTAHLKIK